MTALLRNWFSRRPPPPPVQPAGDEEARYRPIEWSMIRSILTALKPYKGRYALGISLAWTHTMLDLLGPQFVGTIVNFIGDYVGQQERGQSAGFIEWIFHKITFTESAAGLTQTQALTHLTIIIGMWTVVTALSIVFQRWTLMVTQRAGEYVQFDFRRKVFRHMQKLDMGFFDKTKLGRIISRNTSDINGMREVNVWGVAHIIIQSSAILIAAGMLAWTDWRLFLSVAWLGPVLFFVNRHFIRTSASQWQAVREGFTRVSTNLAENINGMRVVTAFNRQNPNLAAFNRLQIDNTENNITAARLNGRYQPTLEVIRYVGRFIILVFGGYLVA
ncbi:MAG TPA: ABC transporter transmembrane domain-containing protein, partial [Tepidisphaeraceae bacterium]